MCKILYLSNDILLHKVNGSRMNQAILPFSHNGWSILNRKNLLRMSERGAKILPFKKEQEVTQAVSLCKNV